MSELVIANTMRGWSFSAEMLAEARRGMRMLNPSLDLGNPCNLNCHYCFIEQKDTERKRRLPAELTADETFLVVRDFAKAGALTVNIVGAGEPLIDPLFPSALRAIATLGMVPVVFTHGAEIVRKPELIAVIQETNATVVVKLNSWDPTLQDAIVGRPGYTERRDTAIQALLREGLAECTPTRLAIDTLAFQGNLKELPSIHRWARRNNVFPITADFIPTGRTAGGQVAGAASLQGLSSLERQTVETVLEPISIRDAVWLRERFEEIDAEYGVRHASCSAYFGGGVCTQILGLYVDVLGLIWPCVARRRVGSNPSLAPLASIRDGALPSEVWASDPYMVWIRRTYDGGCPYKRSAVHDDVGVPTAREFRPSIPQVADEGC